MSVACNLAGGVFGSKAGACFGIDVQAPHGAPSGERFRVDYGSEDFEPLGLELAELLGRLFLPVSKGWRQDVRIHHDPKHLRIIGFVEPADANGSARDGDAANV